MEQNGNQSIFPQVKKRIAPACAKASGNKASSNKASGNKSLRLQ
jgi:hypothetical protein